MAGVVASTAAVAATEEALQPRGYDKHHAYRYQREYLQHERYEVVNRLQQRSYDVLDHQQDGHDDPYQHLHRTYYRL